MKYRIAAFAAAIFLSGCVTTQPTKVPYVDTNVLKEKPIKLYLNVPQTELNAVVPIQDSSAATAQYGLIGALVGGAMDASVNNTNAEIAETNLKPLRDSLLDYDFHSLLLGEVESKFDTEKLNIVEIIKVSNFRKIDEMAQEGETYLSLTVQYKMGSEFRTSFVEANARLVTKAAESGEDALHYKNRFTYFGHYLPAPQKTEEYKRAEIAKAKEALMSLPEKDRKLNTERGKYNRAIKRANSDKLKREDQVALSSMRWQTDMQKTLRNDLNEGITAVVMLLNKDFNDSNGADFYATQAAVTPGYYTGHKSTIIEESADRLILRSANAWSSGSICSAPKTDMNQQVLMLCR